MVYIIILIYILACIWKFDIRRQNTYKNVFYWLLCVLFILLSGLRYKIGTDTIAYMDSWDVYPTFWDGSLSYNLNKMSLFYPEMNRHGIAWKLFVITIKSIYNNFNFLLTFVALIFNLSIFRTIKKYSGYQFLTILIFFLNFKFLEFEFEILRESLAVAVFLFIAFDSFVKKKWIKYYLGCIITILFHYSAIVMFFLPLIRNINLSFYKYVIYFFIPSIIFSLIGRYLVGDLINIYFGGGSYMTEYISRAFSKEYNINYIIQYAFQPCVLLIFLGTYWKIMKNNKFTPIIFFSIIFMNINLIYFTAVRLISYLIIIDCIAVTPIFIHILNKYKSILLCIILLLIFNIPLIYNVLSDPLIKARYVPYQNIINPSQTPDQQRAEYERYFPTIE